MRRRSFPFGHELLGQILSCGAHSKVPSATAGGSVHVPSLQAERDNPPHSREAVHIYGQFHQTPRAAGKQPPLPFPSSPSLWQLVLATFSPLLFSHAEGITCVTRHPPSTKSRFPRQKVLSTRRGGYPKPQGDWSGGQAHAHNTWGFPVGSASSAATPAVLPVPLLQGFAMSVSRPPCV